MDSESTLDHPHMEEPLLRFRGNFLRGPQFSSACEEIDMVDGLPGQHFNQSLTYGTNSNLNKDTEILIQSSPFLASQPQMEWPKETPSAFAVPYSEYCFTRGDGPGSINREHAFMLPSYEPLLPQSYGSRPSIYSAEADSLQSDPLQNFNYLNAMAGRAQFPCDFDADIKGLGDFRVGNTLTVEGQLESASPYAFENTTPVTDLSSSKSSEDGELDDVVSVYGERNSDEPYAKLIYRALLGAPNHSMVLQDIYQWFLLNTDKGNSTSAGWRNSIRHNLSMNAAFCKTERTLVGDDTKKISEWVLHPEAIEKGVTPTTRYRKAGKKSVKSDNPAPSRVRSGRAGGLSAGKTKVQRHKLRRDRRDAPIETPIDYDRGLWRIDNPLASMDCNSQSPPTPTKQELTAPTTASIGYTPHSRFSYHFPIYDCPKATRDAPWTFQDIKEVHLDGPVFYGEGDGMNFGYCRQ